MRVLVYPHLMEVGGSQLNAVELARHTAARGHEVIVFGPQGQLVETVRGWGMEYVTAPHGNSWPSIRNVAALTRIVRERSIDVVHGYEWGPAVELAYGPHLMAGVPLVVTVMSMAVPVHIPRHLPITVGTREMAEEQSAYRPRVETLEPPIDTAVNAPSDPQPFRREWGLDPDDLVLSVVCRMVDEHGKAPGVIEAIAAVGELCRTYRIRLLVVGGGDRLDDVRRAAAEVNDRFDRQVVTVTGTMLDPTPAYAAADVVFGMGGSALKGMAFGKPLIVQGADGYWKRLDRACLGEFLERGWFGGDGEGTADFIRAVQPLLESAALRGSLGDFGRSVAVSRFSLDRASEWLERFYRGATTETTGSAERARSLVGAAIEVAKYKTVMALRRINPPREQHPARIDDAVGAMS